MFFGMCFTIFSESKCTCLTIIIEYATTWKDFAIHTQEGNIPISSYLSFLILKYACILYNGENLVPAFDFDVGCFGCSLA